VILDIDHVALAVRNLEQDIKWIEALGYKPSFIEKGIPNPFIKKELMRRFQKQQSLALLTREGSLSIELLDHGCVPKRRSYYTPVFECLPSDWIEKMGRQRHFDISLREIEIKNLGVDAYLKESDGQKNFQFNKIIVKSRDLKQSIRFWQCFGLQVVNQDDSLALMQFSSVFHKQNYQLYVQNEAGFNDFPLLDDGSFNCLAFISHSVRQERESLRKQGIKVTDIESLYLNAKWLEVFFAQGICGELIEIVGVCPSLKKIKES